MQIAYIVKQCAVGREVLPEEGKMSCNFSKSRFLDRNELTSVGHRPSFHKGFLLLQVVAEITSRETVLSVFLQQPDILMFLKTL